jgi:hypothetical protein
MKALSHVNNQQKLPQALTDTKMLQLQHVYKEIIAGHAMLGAMYMRDR